MQVLLVALVVAGCAVFSYATAQRQAEAAAVRQSTATARAVADSPSVREAIRTARPSLLLQPYAEQVREDSGVSFVTIMSPAGIRWSHRDIALLGKKFIGNREPALEGRTFSETYEGSLGLSVRTVTPVWDDNRIVGLVAAGITVNSISDLVRQQLSGLLAVAAGALALGGLGTYIINARLRRHTYGMNSTELSRLHDYHQATLHAVREGLLMLDRQRRIVLINDGGRELLGLNGPEGPAGGVVGRQVAELGLPAPLTGALLADEPRVDEVHLTADRIVVVNTQPVTSGTRRGTVVTLRDHTELQSLAGELDSVRGFSEALRSQAHEAANRLHTVVSLIELGREEEAVRFATAELELAQALTDQVVAAVGEPVLAALLLGKAAQANERGVELVLAEDSGITDADLAAHSVAPRDLVTILGNLIDNAVDAALGSGTRPRVTVTARSEGDELLLSVSDSGPGIAAASADEVFERGWSTKAAAGRGLGLALVRQAVRRGGGTVTVGNGAEGGAEFVVRMPLLGGDGTVAGAGSETDAKAEDGVGSGAGAGGGA
jgi:sensor histidine kinase regulating citrate/malate metabolism